VVAAPSPRSARWGNFYADYCAREAKLGNPGPLIGYLRSGGVRTPAIDQAVFELLERTEGERARNNRKILQQTRIALEVEGLVADGDAKNQKEAISIVRTKRKIPTRTIERAIAETRKRRGLVPL
jgi:hypothetical protein